MKAEDKSSALAMTQEEILAQVSICGSLIFMNLPNDVSFLTRWYLGFFSRVFEPQHAADLCYVECTPTSGLRNHLQ